MSHPAAPGRPTVRSRLVDRALAWLRGDGDTRTYRRTSSGADDGARGSRAWRRLVSETDLGRPLEFMRSPQDVEVHRDGRWVWASMIGWRQEAGSSCRVMVRVVEHGVEKT